MRLEDLLNNELRIRPPFPTYCIDFSSSENEIFFKVHLASYFWNICNNKLPLGKQVRVSKGSVRVSKGSDFEPKL